MSAMPSIWAGRRRRLLALLVGNGLAQSAAMVGTALLARAAANQLIQAAPAGDFDLVVAGLLGLGLAMAWLRWSERVTAERLGQDYVAEVRLALFDRLAAVPPRVLQRRSRGGVMLRFVGDATALRAWASRGLARLTVGLTATAVAVAAVAVMAWPLAAAAGSVLAAGAVVIFAAGGRLRSAALEARRRRSRLAANVNERIAAVAVMQVFGQAARERRRFDRQCARLVEAMTARAGAVGRLRALVHVTLALAHTAVLVVGMKMVVAGTATAGAVVAAIVVVGLLTPSLRELGLAHEYWQGAIVARRKIEDFLAMPGCGHDGVATIAATPARLEFEQVTVPGVLEGFSAEVPAGALVALMGPSGAGKSTLLALAAGLLGPAAGRILLNGRDLAQCSPAAVRRAVGMVSHDLPLLRGSLAMNLAYRDAGAPVEEIQRVAALCGVDAVVQRLPEGLTTRLTEGGLNLAQGERQLVALARALLGDPPLLLLDDVDPSTDLRVQAALDRVLAHHRGTILIATGRVELARRADIVWQLDQGRLCRIGSAAELLPLAPLANDAEDHHAA